MTTPQILRTPGSTERVCPRRLCPILPNDGAWNGQWTYRVATISLRTSSGSWCGLTSAIRFFPRTEKRHKDMVLARKAKKGWSSQTTPLDSQDLVGNKSTLKQKSHDSIRVYWAPILAMGKLHIATLGEDFPGETPAGKQRKTKTSKVLLPALRLLSPTPPIALSQYVALPHLKIWETATKGEIRRPRHPAGQSAERPARPRPATEPVRRVSPHWRPPLQSAVRDKSST